MQISFSSSDSNWRLWSLWSCSGGENRQNISSTGFLATVVASWFRKAYTSTQRVKQSTATMIYLQPPQFREADPSSLHSLGIQPDSLQMSPPLRCSRLPRCATSTVPTPLSDCFCTPWPVKSFFQSVDHLLLPNESAYSTLMEIPKSFLLQPVG